MKRNGSLRFLEKIVSKSLGGAKKKKLYIFGSRSSWRRQSIASSASFTLWNGPPS
jgi:hypothetical protein